MPIPSTSFRPSALPPELFDQILLYLSSADLHHLTLAYPATTPRIHTHIHYLLYTLPAPAASDLLCYLSSWHRYHLLQTVLTHLPPPLPPPPPRHPRDWLPYVLAARLRITDPRRTQAFLSYVTALPHPDRSALADQLLGSPAATASIVAAKTGRAECLDVLARHPGRVNFYVVLCAAVTQTLGLSVPVRTRWRLATRAEVAVGYVASGYLPPAPSPEQGGRRRRGLSVAGVLTMPGLSAAVKRVLICAGDLDAPEGGEKRVFVACSVAAAERPWGAEVLRMLLAAVREEDGGFAEIVLPNIAAGFMMALFAARIASIFTGEMAERLRVVEVWLEECEDVLFERLAVERRDPRPEWRGMLKLKHLPEVWGWFFPEGRYNALRNMPIGGRG